MDRVTANYTLSPGADKMHSCPTDGLLAGIDIGGTKLAVGVSDIRGTILSVVREPTDRSGGPQPVLRTLERMVHQALDEAAHRLGVPSGRSALKAIGVGVGGPLDSQRTVVLRAPNLPGWDNCPVKAFFEDAFGVPANMDNDASTAALGEARLGAGKGCSVVCYFTVSTGIGGGIVIGGHLYRGATASAGEFGHQIILPNGPPCLCGRRGCLEALASGTSIARRAREQVPRDSVLLRMAGGDPGSITAALVAQAARAGDEFALRLWDETGFYLGIGVSNIINILNPDRVVLGGGVTKAGDLLFDPVRRTVAETAMRELAAACDVVPAALGDNVGVAGAICLAQDLLEPDAPACS
ncbi:MAG: ROK family protein [Armatimonadota bacterium]